MANNENRYPVLWALGRKGYMVQYPLLVALNERGKTLAVTADANIYLQNISKSSQLLCAVEIPTNVSSLIKFLLNWYKTKKELVRQLKNNASVIHIIMASPWDIFFLTAARKTNRPILLTIHDAQQHLGEESFVMDVIRNWAISQADHIAVLSSNVGQTLRLNLNSDHPIHVVDEGLVMRVEPAQPARTFPTERAIKLLFHGRIHAYKGLDLLLDAMALLQNQGRQYALTIAGSGDLTPYQAKLEKLSNVSIHNYFISDAELLQTLESHDVSVLPYVEASQSAVAVDALWAALPAVATPVGALPKQFKHGVDALIIDTVDADALAKAIDKLCSDKQLYEALSLGAYNSYQATGPAKAASQWISLYAEILNKWKI
jgi:glycosyltransferase involved in cell wall biosynthesis